MLALFTCMPVSTLFAKDNKNNIRLVLQLTVDGLRADLLSRYSDRFGEDGFRLLKENGKAFWVSTDSGDFVTSEYYYELFPQWVVDWNAQRKAESVVGKS